MLFNNPESRLRHIKCNNKKYIYQILSVFKKEISGWNNYKGF